MPKPLPEHVRIDADSTLSTEYRLRHHFYARYHFHPEVEITFILEGTGWRVVGDSVESFGDNDFVLLGPNIPHAYQNWRGCVSEAIALKFRIDTFGKFFFETPELNPIAHLLERANRGLVFDTKTVRGLRKDCLKIVNMPPSPERILLFLGVMRALTTAPATPLMSEGFVAVRSSSQSERLAKILSYVDAHWESPLSLAALGKEAHMHPQSLSRFVRQKLGRPLVQYVSELRLANAARALQQTERTVADIAFSCGFNNLSHFNRSFKNYYKMSPRVYRERCN